MIVAGRGSGEFVVSMDIGGVVKIWDAANLTEVQTLTVKEAVGPN